jgi:hypothetical protein
MAACTNCTSLTFRHDLQSLKYLKQSSNIVG